MRIVPPVAGGRRDRDELVSFLAGCREEAKQAGEFRLANITLRVGHIDPLAVLESIFEAEELHFYLEKSGREEAIAGADGVVSLHVSGQERFRAAQEFVEEMLRRTICIGDVDAAYGGPHFFCSFAFFDEPGEASAFPGATVFLPRWQVSRAGGEYTAVANLKVEPDADVEALAEKVWRAHARFSSFHHGVSPSAGEPAIAGSRRDGSPGQREEFEDAVRQALGRIGAGAVQKVVLARFLDLRLPTELNPLHAVNRLRMAYPNCYAYSVANGKGQSLIGATPELLVRRRGDRLETEALAGSAPRGKTAAEDARLAEELLRSEKDGREHRIVIDSIRRRLEPFLNEVQVSAQTRLLQLPNVQHLRTPVAGVMRPGLHLFEVLAELHPTPAVGGTPRIPAYQAIRELETFDRGLYAGAVGWVNGTGDGEFAVAIRATLIDGEKARLYAGAGIVAGSDPAREWQETEVKLRAVLEVLP